MAVQVFLHDWSQLVIYERPTLENLMGSPRVTM